MYRLLVYQAYHQAFLNDYYTALGIVGGRMPIVLTSNMMYLWFYILFVDEINSHFLDNSQK